MPYYSEEREPMITIEEIPVEGIEDFWKSHIKYLVDDGIISDSCVYALLRDEAGTASDDSGDE